MMAKIKLKYPKFSLFILSIIAAYFIFDGRKALVFDNALLSLGYFGTFITGMLYSYGFTAAPATAIFLILAKEQNIFIAGLMGGLGALFSDLLIFKFIRYSFLDEIEKLRDEKIFRTINGGIPELVKSLFFPLLAAFIIASPLPDEIGVTLIAASTRISTRTFSIISFVLNTFGIFAILGIGAQI